MPELSQYELAVVILLSALLLIALLSVYIQIVIYRVVTDTARTTKRKPSVIQDSDDEDQTPTPLPLLDEDEEDGVSIPIARVQYSRRSRLPVDQSSSSPDLASNVYDEITNVIIPRKYLPTYPRQGSSRRKRLPGTSVTNKTSRKLNSFSSTTQAVLTSTISSGQSFSMEESAETPNTAFDTTKLLTFHPITKTKHTPPTSNSCSPTDGSTVPPNNNITGDGTTVSHSSNSPATANNEDAEHQLTYMNMDNVTDITTKDPCSNEAQATYVPMSSVVLDSQLHGFFKRPMPSPRRASGFYIAESPTWITDQGGTVITHNSKMDPCDCHVMSPGHVTSPINDQLLQSVQQQRTPMTT